MGRTKTFDELMHDGSGHISVAIRLKPNTLKKVDILIRRVEETSGFTPSRGQVLAGLINKAVAEGDGNDK